jgi:hypothetical protein
VGRSSYSYCVPRSVRDRPPNTSIFLKEHPFRPPQRLQSTGESTLLTLLRIRSIRRHLQGSFQANLAVLGQPEVPRLPHKPYVRCSSSKTTTIAAAPATSRHMGVHSTILRTYCTFRRLHQYSFKYYIPPSTHRVNQFTGTSK